MLNFYVCDSADHYQVIGRKVHMDFVREHLQTKKKISLGDSQERSNNIKLEILADTVYVKVRYKNFEIYCNKMHVSLSLCCNLRLL